VLADAAQLASLADETPEGRSIVVLAKQQFNLRERDVHALARSSFTFSAQTRMSGVNRARTGEIRKGAADAVRAWVAGARRRVSRGRAAAAVEETARRGSTPLVVADGERTCWAWWS
jgi:K+-transporting ATPase ATPase B chain